MIRPITILDTGSPDRLVGATMSGGTKKRPHSLVWRREEHGRQEAVDMSLPGSRGDCKVRAATVRARLPAILHTECDTSTLERSAVLPCPAFTRAAP